MDKSASLIAIRLVHTLAWAFFACCVVLLPFAAHARRFDLAFFLIGFVTVEIGVLAFNRWRCPLTAVAARYTADRKDNFDIYLPLWLARYNKEIFGSLFVAGVVYTAFEWWHATAGIQQLTDCIPR